MSFLSDPTWSATAIAAGVFTGLLANVLWKAGKWLVSSVLPAAREVNRQVVAKRDAFVEHLVQTPHLLLLNTLYLFMILGIGTFILALLFALPSIIEAVHESAQLVRPALCEWYILRQSLCDAIQPNAMLDQLGIRFLLGARVFLFFLAVVFYTWFWSRASVLLRTYRRALGGYSLGPSSNLHF